ncbi:MAG TPA: ShlB/FhaC/HecB family hemolysin secretion/activation protein [Ideonella sp.]|nr:ShlB/FhaC/HecB family hemolysin secretion/activation protein [Ideonella sp.]
MNDSFFIASLLAAFVLLGAAGHAAAAAEPVAATAEPAFDIWEYEIEGNSVLPVEAIERAVQPHLGPGLSMRAVEAARNALEAAYQQAGFVTVLVDIPEQRIDDGVVRLAVLEGKLGQVDVSGSRYHALGAIRKALPALQPGVVPNFVDAQTQLSALNRSDDRRVSPVVKPGRLPGTVDMELQVADKLPWGGQFELNNQHAVDTTDLRASDTLRYDNLFQQDHSLALTLQGAPGAPDQSRVAVANYTVPLDNGDAWGLSATFSNSDVETLGGTQAIGHGRTFGLRRHHSFVFGGAASTLSLGADLKLLKDRVSFGGDSFETPVHYLPFQTAYSGQWAEGRESLQLNASLGAAWQRILQRDVDCNGTRQDQFDCKGRGLSGSFGVFRADARWTMPWGDGSLLARLGGQAASGPLISAEQYALGGAETVRGYFEGEVSADHGLLGSLEWRGPNLAASSTAGWSDARPVVFVDLGRGLLAQATAGQAAPPTLSSAGVGLRLNASWLEGVLDLAWPTRSTPNTSAGDGRVHVRVVARY